jgi:hypothetical protein
MKAPTVWVMDLALGKKLGHNIMVVGTDQGKFVMSPDIWQMPSRSWSIMLCI